MAHEILSRCQAQMLAKMMGEMALIGEAGFGRRLCDGVTFLNQQGRTFLDASANDILIGGKARTSLELPGKMKGAGSSE